MNLLNDQSSQLKKALKTFGLAYAALILISLVYLWLVTQNRYISESMIKVTTEAGNMDMTDVAAAAAASSGAKAAAGLSGAQMTSGYIASANLLFQLEKEFDLVRHYRSPRYDLIFRMKKSASIEDRLEFYRKRITSHYDLLEGVNIITVDTFDRDLSLRINQRILELTENFINGINHQIANQQVAYYVEELKRAENNVQSFNERILAMQDEKRIISPESAIETSLRTIDEMYSQIVTAETEINTLLRDSPNSPKIELLQSRVKTLNESLEREQSKLSGDDRKRMNLFMMQYKDLQERLQFAMQIRNNAEVTLEKNRAMRNQHSQFFILFQQPFRPEEHGLPRRPYATITILVVGALLFYVLRTMTYTLFEK